jgi:hypothetical protein
MKPVRNSNMKKKLQITQIIANGLQKKFVLIRVNS